MPPCQTKGVTTVTGQTHPPHREILRSIATRAMIEQGLLPTFSSGVSAELQTLQASAMASGVSGIRDLTGLLWCSIDNDDSRDLDQLTVAQNATGDAVSILVAVADV